MVFARARPYIIESFIAIGVCPVHKLTSIVLDYSKVDKVEEPEDGSLTKLCPSVEEMHLCNNSISHWNHVS